MASLAGLALDTVTEPIKTIRLVTYVSIEKVYQVLSSCAICSEAGIGCHLGLPIRKMLTSEHHSKLIASAFHGLHSSCSQGFSSSLTSQQPTIELSAPTLHCCCSQSGFVNLNSKIRCISLVSILLDSIIHYINYSCSLLVQKPIPQCGSCWSDKDLGGL